MSQDEAAALMNVSVPTVKRAKLVQQQAEPEVVERYARTRYPPLRIRVPQDTYHARSLGPSVSSWWLALAGR